MAPEKENSPPDGGWEHRVLCSDESCIGVVGPDGRCKECGLAYEGVLPWLVESGTPTETAGNETGGVSVEDPEDFIEDPGDREEADQEIVGADDETVDADDDWERRVLCSDESCIGVIGSDGCCKECGRPYQKD